MCELALLQFRLEKDLELFENQYSETEITVNGEKKKISIFNNKNFEFIQRNKYIRLWGKISRRSVKELSIKLYEKVIFS